MNDPIAVTSSAKRPRILMDCDPGIDDAFAILCALRYCDLAAVTTVNGNVTIDNTTRNARYLLELAGADIPVHRGAGRPLRVPAIAADEIHGISGLGDLRVPESASPEHELGAVDAIREFCSTGDATIVATGPLTNIANALTIDPSLAERIARLYWMGGSTAQGNITEFAEFNAWADPHAADVTMRSGIPITMYGLNLTHQVRMGDQHIEQLRVADTATSSVLAELLRYYSEHGVNDSEGQPVHDTCAILGLTHPEMFRVAESNIVTHVDGKRRGMTEVHDQVSEQTTTGSISTITVATSAHADAIIDLVIDAAVAPFGQEAHPS